MSTSWNSLNPQPDVAAMKRIIDPPYPTRAPKIRLERQRRRQVIGELDELRVINWLEHLGHGRIVASACTTLSRNVFSR